MIAKNEYINQLLQLYVQQSDTPNRFSRYDRKLAEHLFNEGVSLDEMKAAFLLGSARRAAKKPNSFALGPIRSLHYFLPILQEVRRNQLPPDYLNYLKSKGPR
jgi:hypothetical protein